MLAASLLIGAQTKLVLEPVESFEGKTLPITAQVVSLTESRNGRGWLNTTLEVKKGAALNVVWMLRRLPWCQHRRDAGVAALEGVGPLGAGALLERGREQFPNRPVRG